MTILVAGDWSGSRHGPFPLAATSNDKLSLAWSISNLLFVMVIDAGEDWVRAMRHLRAGVGEERRSEGKGKLECCSSMVRNVKLHQDT